MGKRCSRKAGTSLAFVAAALVCFFSSPSPALKADDDALIEGAKLCTRYLPRHERQYGIPEHLLAAIASTESGRFHKALGMNLPWPWTINVEGTGYFFDTKQEAVDAVRAFQARGFMSIDVGCMQVNLFHHPNAFATLDQAFDPAYNVAYGAQFLKRNFDEEGSWRKATADYHSRSLFYGDPYARLVFNQWSRIINKVADARAGRPILTAAASKPSYGLPRIRAGSYHPVRMHSVSVAHDETTVENGVVIVRPDYQSQQVASRVVNTEDETFVTHPAITTIRASDLIERTGITPGGLNNPKNVPEPNGGAEIVRVRADGTVVAKGQFEPSAHIVHATDNDLVNTAPNAAISSGPGGDTPKSPFVFNN